MRLTTITACVAGLLIACGGFAQNQWSQQVNGFLNGERVPLFWKGTSNPCPYFADVDSDGDQDLLLGGRSRVTFFRNDGDRYSPEYTLVDENLTNSEPPSESMNPQPYCSPTLADIDGDGDLDLLVGQTTAVIHGESLCFYRNVGTAKEPTWVYEDHPGFPSFPSKDNNLHPDFGDFNGDGLIDLVLGKGLHNSGVEVRWYVNTGTKEVPNLLSTVAVSATPDLRINDPSEDEGGPYPRLRDIDNDGDLDLFLGFNTDAGDGTHTFFVRFYRNVGDAANPSYEEDTTVLEGLGHNNTTSWAPALVDLDGDRDIDFIAGENSGLLHVYINQGSPEDPDYQVSNRNFFLDYLDQSKPAFHDLDDDGDLDMLIGGNSDPGALGSGRILLFKNVGNPVSPRWKLANERYADITDATLGYSEYFHPTFADFDRDGMDELYVSLLLEGRIERYINTGSKAEPQWTLDSTRFQDIQFGQHDYPNTQKIFPAFADLNGDSYLDLVIGEGPKDVYNSWSWELPNVWYYENLQDGTVASPIKIIASTEIDPPYPNETSNWGSKHAAPAFHDMDGDGDLDMLLGVGYHRLNFTRDWIHYFENTGTSVAPAFVRRATDYLPGSNMVYHSFPVFADINGDGQEDLFVGGQYGGLRCYINISDRLKLNLESTTILPGESRDLMVQSAAILPVTWSFHANRSGASLIPNGTACEYVAGATAGVIDAIEVVDASGTIGRAYINVISAEDIAKAGKAIIVAGKRSGDTLWPTTNRLANQIYRTLLHRGFSKENVDYLSNELGQDVLGNGETDHIDDWATRANLENAITGSSAANTLLVYLIDHGGEQQSGAAYLRMNESEILLASELDTWLDDLQSSSGIPVVLAVDACQSGSFLDEATPPLGLTRVTLASADSDEPAFFTAQGLISFTDSFLSGINSGLTLGQAFKGAQGAMDRFQQAQLDDDGDGLYDKDLDGAVADGLVIGATFIAGADRPQIGKISANQALDGTPEATLWASDIASVYAIDRVWATVVPPDFQPDQSDNPENPIETLPEFDLVWNVGQSRYEATYNGFTKMGAYKVIIYAQDIWGGVSIPKQTYINQTGSNEKVIIVAAEGDYDANSPQSFIVYEADYAYVTCRHRWIAADKIQYLSSSGSTGVDDTPTKANLQSAIETWALDATPQLTIYLIGPGTTDAFQINGSEQVTSTELDGWIDSLQTATGCKVIVIYEAPESGTFLDNLTPPATTERICIACSSPLETPYFEAGGLLSFSQYFLDWLFHGMNVREAFSASRNAMRALTGYTQNALLDDDGDGDGDKFDGALAKVTYLGAAFVTGDEPPTIGEVSDGIELSAGEEEATLWASSVFDPDGAGIDHVWVEIVPPGFDPAMDTIESATLVYSATDTRYEAVVSTFIETGEYRLVFFARDREDELSLPVEAVLYKDIYPDIYEVDDHPEAAPIYVVSNTDSIPYQLHNFHDQDDVDWVKFYVPYLNWPFTFSTQNPGVNCDTSIDVYSEGDYSTTVFGIDDWGKGEGEAASWFSTGTGWYYVKIGSGISSDFGNTTDYELLITSDAGPNNGLATTIGVIISWEDPPWLNKPSLSEVYGYNIYRAEGEVIRDESFEKINLSLVLGHEYTDITAFPNRIYYYMVYAVTDGGEVPITEVMQVDTSNPVEIVAVEDWRYY